jgi:L-glutamine:2-deoxy-scyllo-inosose/3-amino-2,3-dideoxy-scyllo-inosose aminotransferase
MTAALAIDGGTPVRGPGQRWPRWPLPAAGAEENVLEVLHNGRWAISSPAGERELFERRFAEHFADYVGTRYCVPVDHGSSALVVALEALGLEFGDRVLVPSLTWTASATAVFRAGLVPILVDVDRETGCVGPEHVDLDVDARALVVVHWSCAMADVPALEVVTEPRGITIVEDCAQAHGARWLGRQAGSMGRLGCFSFQNGKVLSGGEGGAVVTDDESLLQVLEELRADSRSYRTDRSVPGELDLAETATTMGSNFCLSELTAALLCAQLRQLEGQNEIRQQNYRLLSELLVDVPGVRLVEPEHQQDRMSIYELPVLFDPLPRGMRVAELAEALTAELGVRFYLTDEPLHRSVLLQPWTKSTLRPLAEEFVEAHRGREYPNSDYLQTHVVVTHHSTLLGTEEDMVDIAAAIAKVAAARALPSRRVLAAT